MLLLLLGVKPCVLLWHSKAAFVEQMVSRVFEPWLKSSGPPRLSSCLQLRRVTHKCAPSAEACFEGAWVLSAKRHLQLPHVEAAFFPPATLVYM